MLKRIMFFWDINKPEISIACLAKQQICAVATGLWYV